MSLQHKENKWFPKDGFEVEKQNEIKSAEWRKKNLSKNSSLANVVCSCYMCGKSIEQPEEQYDVYGEMVCQDCWDYNVYQALQDFYNCIQRSIYECLR